MGKKDKTTPFGVLLDTSFLIRLLDGNSPLHSNAVGYFRYFCENDIPMYVSTITIAEYCVRGELSDLPLQVVRILPFNINHAETAGRFARCLFDAKARGYIEVDDRKVIPNDAKLFAQGAFHSDIKYFVTSDVKSKTCIEVLRKSIHAQVEHLDINTPYANFFGVIDLDTYQ